jgi:uncharacterized protein YciI
MKKNLLSAFVLIIFFLSNAMAQQGDQFFVFLNTNPDREQLPKEQFGKLQLGHLENIQRLAKEGTMLVAGPFEGGGGLFIIKANSLEEVDSILSTDPAISADRFKLEIYPFHQFTGSVCLVGEEYDMATYAFFRVSSRKGIEQEVFKKHIISVSDEIEVQMGAKVIAAASFGNNEGIIIADKSIDGEVQFEFKENIEFNARNLWVAKGSFCEE